MASSVSVLAPNGRRQTIKCTPNTTIMQIIEEVCKKQGYKSEEYDIKHHNKVLDTTATFRFSGLPNNAQLELTPATKIRQESEVILAVNLDNGERIMGNFMPSTTLWDVLINLCPNEIGDHPVIIYTRREIWGEALKTTTLRSLGLTGGRAMVRLVNKNPEELKVQANVSAPIPAKPVEEKPYIRILKTNVKEVDMSEETKSLPVQNKQQVDLIKLAKEKRKLPESPSLVREESPKNKVKTEASETEEMMEVDVESEAPLKVPLEAHKIEPESEPEPDFIFLGERNAMLFSLESATSIPAEELPDEFFELTIDDARRLLKDIRRTRSNMEDGILMTSAQRNLEESKKQLRQLNRYKKAIIRVQFPDRTVLQGSFNPSETVADVKEFVSGFLKRKEDFYLYTTPPKDVLVDDQRLIEIGCVPGALLHLGTNSDALSLKDELKDKFTTNSMASLAASKFRQQNMRPNKEVDKKEEQDLTIYDPGPSTSGAFIPPQSSQHKNSNKSEEKTPKWFKKPMK